MEPSRIKSANEWVWNRVEGWVGHRIFQILEFIHAYHQSYEIHGDIMEIGVHHGKLFFILSTISRSTEKCIALDLFENQSLNLDKSGKGSLNSFKRHLDDGFADLANRVYTISADSMSLTPCTVRNMVNTAGVRLLSIDGGHTPAHCLNDLCLAQEIIVPGGVAMLDDFFGVGWPGVSEGYFNYMSVANRRLAPFLMFQNKLFLTTFSEQPLLLKALRDYLDKTVGPEIHAKWKYVTMSGHQLLAYHGD